MIDTAEMYGEGVAEEIVGEAMGTGPSGRRNSLYLVSKVYPHNATRSGTIAACERSLKRLGTDRLDLYLLHWRGGSRLEETFEAFHRLREAGKIRDFGVSNFDRGDMEDAARSNQILYCLSRRGPEYDLLPWMAKHGVPCMAYSPLDQGRLLNKAPLKKIAGEVGCTPAQLALAWVLAQPNVVTIPKSMTRERVKENFEALEVKLSRDVMAELDKAFPPPSGKQSLETL
jgi:diketogulonate reductase-like aldo/keto reductase